MLKYNSSVLLEKIEEKRVYMIETALKYGFTAVETVRVSQELDALIDVYQMLLHTKEKKEKYCLHQ
ncbi:MULTISPECIES: Spo0E family sporulation regulatory protein-aspartic acid phosphatase [Bacillaceae]|uniref:Spo0E family sporulation regulatory protein-aspartic acid phosphatase n=1 Tax=Bacillaceae TaxID=186817 RepID=UPI00101C129D|nr:aspartyl-phosphate phosphatase Spo0E family protein [Ectobacillus funiculus]